MTGLTRMPVKYEIQRTPKKGCWDAYVTPVEISTVPVRRDQSEPQIQGTEDDSFFVLPETRAGRKGSAFKSRFVQQDFVRLDCPLDNGVLTLRAN
jgi:hypothetical protein